jgi:hypothetical protein
MMRKVIGIRRGRGLAASLVEAQIGLTAKGKAEEGSWKEIGQWLVQRRYLARSN